MALTALNALLPSRGNNPPPEIRSFLRDFGQHGIVGLAVCRKPIVAAVKLVLDIISFGQVSRNQKALGYDAILHLFLALTLQDPRTSVRTFHLLEKNETVHTVPIPWDYFNNSTTERRLVPVTDVPSKWLTVNDFFSNGIRDQRVNDPQLGFWLYDPRNANCQRFCLWMLRGSRFIPSGPNMTSNYLYQFVVQDALETMVSAAINVLSLTP